MPPQLKSGEATFESSKEQSMQCWNPPVLGVYHFGQKTVSTSQIKIMSTLQWTPLMRLKPKHAHKRCRSTWGSCIIVVGSWFVVFAFILMQLKRLWIQKAAFLMLVISILMTFVLSWLDWWKVSQQRVSQKVWKRQDGTLEQFVPSVPRHGCWLQVSHRKTSILPLMETLQRSDHFSVMHPFASSTYSHEIKTWWPLARGMMITILCRLHHPLVRDPWQSNSMR